MKKVKLNQIMAGPKGSFPLGSIVELSDSEADYLISTHQAVVIEKVKVDTKIKIADKIVDKETADLKAELKSSGHGIQLKVGQLEDAEIEVRKDLDPNK